MRIVVLIAGVADPKWPLTMDADGRPQRQADRLVMSPFDESALEIALRLRDANAGEVAIAAIVLGGGEAEKLGRAVAAFNIAAVECHDVPFDAACDIGYLASALAKAVPGEADLVLIGREFGDCDDGALPALLASRLGRAFFGRAQSVDAAGGQPRFMREAQSHEQWVRMTGPMLVSVTNDRRNRLRKPLMKNVMMARQATIGRRHGDDGGRPHAKLARITPIATMRSTVDGPRLRGATAENARALLDLVRRKMTA